MTEQALPRMPSRPRVATPRGACDTHTHVFPAISDFPLSGPPSYTPPLAPASLHREMLDTVGVDHAVLVQPAPYGLDVSALVDALRQSRGRLRGVGTATSQTTDDALGSMRTAGVCGLRFTEARLPSGERYRGSVAADELVAVAARMRSHDMHAQLWPSPDAVGELLDRTLPLNVPLVIEHMGGVDIRRGIGDSGFQLLLALLREGRVWVKLTVCRRSAAAPDYPDLRAFHDALVKANPLRLLWGSDWPFVRMDARAPDVAQLLDLFGDWIIDESVRQSILVDNPKSLYHFE